VTALLAEGLLRAEPVGAPAAHRPRSRAPRRLVGLLLVAGTLWSLHAAGVGSRPLVHAGGWPQVRAFLSAALHPRTDAAFLRVVGESALVTAAYALLGCALALVLGLVGGAALSRASWGGRGRAATGGWVLGRAALAVPRGLHEAVWGLLLVNVLGLDPLVAVLAIGLPYGAVTAKVFADLLDEAPRSAHTALVAAGAGRARALVYGLLPFAGPDLLSYAFYRLECSVRSAVVLGIVGAGGLGFQLDLSFSALRYDEMWTVIAALVLLCGATDLLSGALRRRLAAPGRRPPPALLPAAAPVLLLGLVGWAWIHLDVRLSSLWSSRAAEQARALAVAAWPPRHDLAHLGELWRLTVQTFQMSLLAFVLATAAGIALSVVAARPTSRPAGPARWAAHVLVRTGLLLCRAVPPPVWALVVLFVLRPGPLSGAVALAAYNTGVLGRLMAEGQDSLPAAPVRSLRAAGAPRSTAWLYGVLPRALPKDLAYGLYRWEVAARDAVLVGLVGAGGLGQLLAFQIAGFDWPGVTSTLLALVALTLVVDLLSTAARHAWR
jgi:phosphonate transport system permease protein